MSMPSQPPSIQLTTRPIKEFESIQYYDSVSRDMIWQSGNRFGYRIGEFTGSFRAPLKLQLQPFHWSRLGRRLARLDKGVCLPVPGTSNLFVFYQGRAYLFDMQETRLQQTGQFNFRNPLHAGTTVTESGEIYFGEYFYNSSGREVRVYCSKDGGRSWDVIYTFGPQTIWHVHGVTPDPFCPGRFWINTGDFEGQCKLLMTDDDFRTVTDCTSTDHRTDQIWRSASLMFTPDSLVWGMDSPNDQSHIVRFDRVTGKIELGQQMPGPVWFAKQLTDGIAVLQTSVEWYGRLKGSTSRYAKIFASSNLEDWTEIQQYKKDKLHPRYFRHGVIHFSQGPQSSQDFTMHGDALIGLDGNSISARITDAARALE